MAVLHFEGKKVRTLKIKKVDDKPMVIHTKEKAKIYEMYLMVTDKQMYRKYCQSSMCK